MILIYSILTIAGIAFVNKRQRKLRVEGSGPYPEPRFIEAAIKLASIGLLMIGIIGVPALLLLISHSP